MRKEFREFKDKMIRVEYGTNDFRYDQDGEYLYRMLTADEVVEAFIREFSASSKKEEEIVLDIFKGIDPSATEVEQWELEQAVKALVKKGDSITKIVQKVLAPAYKLAQYNRDVLKKYCRGLDKEEKK